jgi:spermidine synthase
MKRNTIKIALLLMGSGACALIYQTAWLREFRLIFGASTAASAAVLAIFMGGLGAGGIVLGKRVDRCRRPLEFYANLELLIALTAASTPGLLWLVREAYIWTGGTSGLGMAMGTVARLFLSTLVLIVPTVLMGGTLPAAARAAEEEEDVSRRNLALLYGLNTLGAVTGAALSTFLFLELFGNRKTLWLAALANLLVGLGARSLSRRLGEGAAAAQEPVAAVEPVPGPAAHPGDSSPGGEAASRTGGAADLAAGHVPPSEARAPVPAGLVLGAAAMVGFAFLLMEIVWYRMLGPILGGSSFTFGLILAVALLGIGLGGAAYGLLMSNRPSTLRGFALTCGLEALCIAIPFALGDQLAFLALLLRSLGSLGFLGHVAGWTVVAAVAVLPASFVAGVQFPLLIALLGRGREQVGRHVGLAYGLNTSGAIAGSLAGGFGILPLLTAPGTWRMVVVMMAVLGAAAQALSYRSTRRGRPALLPLGTAAAALLMILATGPTAAWRHGQIGAGRSNLTQASPNQLIDWAHHIRRTTSWETEGVESSIALSTINGYAFVVNGKIDGNARGDAGTQIMAGLLGAILHPHPASAMVIGLGTGSTAGWLGCLTTMERVDVVELEPAVLHVAEVCAPVNQGVLTNPKVRISIGDAREALLTSSLRYDIIFSEPSNPYRAGVASLYTRDFYQAVAKRLEKDGLFLQWLQAYEVDGTTIQTAFATLKSVFPVVETWLTESNDLLLLCTEAPVRYQSSSLRERIHTEPYRTSLEKAWRVTDLEGLLAHFLASDAFSAAVAGRAGGILNTDDRNIVEFGFARTLGSSSFFDLREMRDAARARGEDRPAIDDVDWPQVTERQASMAFAFEIPPEVHPTSDRGAKARTQAKIRYEQGDLGGAYQLWRSQTRKPVDLIELLLCAESAAESGDQGALEWIEKLRAFEPVEADIALARLRFCQGKAIDAAETIEKAYLRYREDPWALRMVVNRSFELAVSIVKSAPRDMGLRVLRSLEAPFSLRLANDRRLFTLMDIAEVLDPSHTGEMTRGTFRNFEPSPPWDWRFLLQRFRSFDGASDPLAEASRRDLEQFIARGGAPFSMGLEPEVPAARRGTDTAGFLSAPPEGTTPAGRPGAAPEPSGGSGR